MRRCLKLFAALVIRDGAMFLADIGHSKTDREQYCLRGTLAETQVRGLGTNRPIGRWRS
jgi:hypothetical protein